MSRATTGNTQISARLVLLFPFPFKQLIRQFYPASSSNCGCSIMAILFMSCEDGDYLRRYRCRTISSPSSTSCSSWDLPGDAAGFPQRTGLEIVCLCAIAEREYRPKDFPRANPTLRSMANDSNFNYESF